MENGYVPPKTPGKEGLPWLRSMVSGEPPALGSYRVCSKRTLYPEQPASGVSGVAVRSGVKPAISIQCGTDTDRQYLHRPPF